MFDIVEKLVKINWLYEKVFWNELLNRVVYNQKKELYRSILKNVYGYEDVDELFDKSIIRDEFTKLSKIIFRITENTGNGKKEK